MKITCEISTTFKGDPAIKITQDCAQVVLDVHTQDYNSLLEMVGKNLILSDGKS